MATKNKPVTAYLPQELEDALTEYCISKGLVRDYNNGEQKPQLGTAVVKILESHFFSNDQRDISPPFPSSELAELKDTINALASRVEALESNIAANTDNKLESTALSKINSNGLNQDTEQDVITNRTTEATTLPDLKETFPIDQAATSKLSQEKGGSAPITDNPNMNNYGTKNFAEDDMETSPPLFNDTVRDQAETDSDNKIPISQRKLSQKLKVSNKTLQKWRSEGNEKLAEETRKRDPENHAWLYDAEQGLYYRSED